MQIPLKRARKNSGKRTTRLDEKFSRFLVIFCSAARSLFLPSKMNLNDVSYLMLKMHTNFIPENDRDKKLKFFIIL